MAGRSASASVMGTPLWGGLPTRRSSCSGPRRLKSSSSILRSNERNTGLPRGQTTPASRRRRTVKRTSLAAIAAALLGACSPFHVDQGLVSEIENAAAQTGSQPNAVREALLPPLRAEMPKGPGTPVEPRFDLVVNAAPARQGFMSLVSGTRYSMIVNPAVSGTLSLNLKDVTVREALEAVREVYGYEFRIDGTRIYVESAGLQTRVFQVNYLIGLRSGRSDVRVSSGAISGTQHGGAGTPVAAVSGGPGSGGAPSAG